MKVLNALLKFTNGEQVTEIWTTVYIGEEFEKLVNEASEMELTQITITEDE